MKCYTVSVLVPVYGVERFIERCARSLFEQTYDSIEFIFVDDCTKDRSIEILQKVVEAYPSRKEDVRIIRHSRNRGVAAARNTALEHARGGYIMHVDSDDTLEPGAVLSLIETALSEDADLVVGRINLVSEGGGKWLLDRPVVNSKDDYLQRLLDWGSVELSVVARLFRRTLFEQSDIRFIEDIDFGDDFSVMPRLVYHARHVAFLDEAVYNYDKTNEASYSSQRLSDRHATSLVRAAEIVYSFFEVLPDALLYEKAIIRGKAKIKCFIMKALPQQLRKKYQRLYPELDARKDLGFPITIRLLLIKNNRFLLLRLYEKAERSFQQLLAQWKLYCNR